MLNDIVEVGLAVRDMEAAIKRFETLFGLKLERRETLPQWGMKAAIFPLDEGKSKRFIALMEPTDPSSALAHFLNSHGEGVYLIGFEVEDVDGAAKKLQERGARVQHQPGQAVFVHPKDVHGLFVELVKPDSGYAQREQE